MENNSESSTSTRELNSSLQELSPFENLQGAVVQSIVSLTGSLVVKMLTFLLSTITNSQVFLLKM